MSTEQYKAMIRDFYDRVSRGDLSAIDEYSAPDFVDHDAYNPQGDLEGLRQSFRMLRAAFPDLRVEAEAVIAEGDTVVARFTVTGTQQGEFMGNPPTGKSFRVTGFDMVRIQDGKAVEHWGLTDQVSMLQQLGVIPGPQQ